MFGDSASASLWHQVLGQLGIHEKFGDAFSRHPSKVRAALIRELEAAAAPGTRAQLSELKREQTKLDLSPEAMNDALAAVDLRPFLNKVRAQPCLRAWRW